MSPYRSQLDRVRDRLLQVGYITRNQCLGTRPAITRLGARINDLKAEGFVFETKQEHGDYVYKLISKPAPKPLTLAL
jgi:hypothetical protein